MEILNIIFEIIKIYLLFTITKNQVEIYNLIKKGMNK